MNGVAFPKKDALKLWLVSSKNLEGFHRALQEQQRGKKEEPWKEHPIPIMRFNPPQSITDGFATRALQWSGAGVTGDAVAFEFLTEQEVLELMEHQGTTAH